MSNTVRPIFCPMIRGILLMLGLVALSACGTAYADTIPASNGSTNVAATATGCQTPAPGTASGYAALFASLPQSQWGAADLAITVPLAGRSVWLFGDTFSTTRFAHSTAVVQTGGCLHVSNQGAQLLPNDDASHIYWITSARAYLGHLLIVARSIHLTGTCGFCFADAGFSRTATVAVSAAGDLTFQRWGARYFIPLPNPGPLYSLPGVDHFAYARHAHPELRLSDGQALWTEAQNWNDGVMHPFAAYRPIFHDGPF